MDLNSVGEVVKTGSTWCTSIQLRESEKYNFFFEMKMVHFNTISRYVLPIEWSLWSIALNSVGKMVNTGWTWYTSIQLILGR